MNNGIVILEHVEFFDVWEWLHAYMPIQVTKHCFDHDQNLPYFFKAALSLTASLEACSFLVCPAFFILLWVPKQTRQSKSIDY